MRAFPPTLCLALLSGCGPSEAELLLHEGIVAHQKQDTVVARDRYLRALELDSGLEGPNTNLALLALGEGKPERALELLEAELKAAPESQTGRLNRALLAAREGHFERAVRDAEAVWQAAADSEQVTPEGRRSARLLWAIAARAQGVEVAKLREALAPVLDPWEDADPVRRAARRLLGVLAFEAGQPEVALAHLVAADHPSVRPLRAAVLLSLGRAGEAAELLEGQEGPEAILLHAHALAATGRAEVARARLAPLASPEMKAAPALRAAAYRMMARLAADAGRWDEALAQVDAATLQQESPPLELWLDRALCLAHLGRLDEARVVLAGVLREAPEEPRAKALKTLLR